jgi:hypothetical protein
MAFSGEYLVLRRKKYQQDTEDYTMGSFIIFILY